MIAATRDLSPLRRAESRLRNLLEAVPDAITGIDRDRRIVLVNQATERLLGRPRSRLLGRPYAHVLPDDARDGVDRAVAEMFTHPPDAPPRTVYTTWSAATAPGSPPRTP